MQSNDIIRITHMRDAARDALSFSAGMSRECLNTDRMLVLSIVKCIEIIGEAANSVSGSFRVRYPQIPWIDIVGMRNRLIHAYYDVNVDIVWKTVAEDLPPLLASLEDIIRSETV